MTVEFDKDSKLEWPLLEKDQAPFYICFLEVEIDRHRRAIKDAQYEQVGYKSDYLMWKLWQSAIHRHVNKVERTKSTIQEVRHWFEIDG